MKNEFEFRGYILENEFEKKQIIIKELVGNICDKYIFAKVNNNIIECKRLSLKLHKLLNKFDEVLGLNLSHKEELELPEEIKDILEERKSARENKDWAKSDELRDKLLDLGYIVKDTKNGVEVTLKK